jgi:hypothetical protein
MSAPLLGYAVETGSDVIRKPLHRRAAQKCDQTSVGSGTISHNDRTRRPYRLDQGRFAFLARAKTHRRETHVSSNTHFLRRKIITP